MSLSTQQSVVIGALYRPGSCADNDTCLIEYLGPALDVARTHGTHIVLAGDFNVHHETWLCSSKTTVAGEALEELCAEHQLHQHVLQPTRGLNTLDLILSNMPVPIDTTVKAPLGRSDHGVVLADFYLTPDAEQATSRTVWRYNQADWGRLRAFYRTTDWSTIVTDDPEESCRKLSDVISSGMQKFIPTKQLVTRPADPKWWTPECTTALNTKDKAWKAWRHNIFSEAHKACFMRSVEDAILANVRARTSWELRVRRKLSRGGLKDKQWWSVLKSAAGASHGSSIPCLVDDAGHQLRINAAKANCLGRYFANKCSLGDDDLGPGDLPHVRQPGVTPLSRIHFRLQTVKRLLNQLDVGKASGPDNIPARVLKECSHELASPLTSLFALCFRKGVQPEAWKSARVVPVYKKGSLSNPKNYRPVSLLPIISKVMERIVNCQIVNHLEKHHLLSTKQYGFRSGLGTADLLAVLGHDWSLAAGSGGCAHVLAVDIAGAFDRVSHPGVLHKAATLGIGGSLLQWLRDYLRNRTLSAIVNGQESAEFQIKAGVPQGSILGPTLFLMYVNDAETCLSPSTRMGVYADDTTLYTIIRSRHDSAGSIADMQSSLDRLSSWGEQWRIRFEPTKSQLLHIGHHRNPWPLPDLTFGAHDIPCGDELKLLGVTFDSKLTFRRHLRNVSLRAVARLGFLRRASSFLGREGRLTTYRGFVRPVLEYAPLTWMGAANSHLQSLDRVQRKALAIIGPDALLQSLAARRQVYALTYMYKLMCLMCSSQLLHIAAKQ